MTTAGGKGREIGRNAAIFEARVPLDAANARLRMLAVALGPASMRVSGTWANTVYFQDAGEDVPSAPPAGFQGVLSRRHSALG